MKNIAILICCVTLYAVAKAQQATIIPIAEAWSNNSVNTVVFRKNSLTTYKDTQFAAFYNNNKYVVLAKRKLGTSHWQIQQTPYRGNTNDAHNCISIMADGAGYLHLAWDHHNNPLHYCKSIAPGSLQMGEPVKMTGIDEQSVSYPEFYKTANGDLLFLYRNGGSGRGNMVINRYNTLTKKWVQLNNNLIDGEGKRNAYWQACVDSKDIIHISWVWRESPDVSSNHDMCYARSLDGGITWEKSTGAKYQLPINAASAEYICFIPQKSELINQTSMYADENSNVFIGTYWRALKDSVPQYHLIYNLGLQWKVLNTGFRTTAFSLNGTGTKKIPIARPQIISWKHKHKQNVAFIYRDAERKDYVSIATSNDIENNKWVMKDLWKEDMGSWEPTYDTELWKTRKTLDLFVLKSTQIDGEGKANVQPQMAGVIEWKP
jgi:hypothetical protein